MTSMWVSDGSPEITIKDGVVYCTPTTNHDNVYGAMFVDTDISNSGLNSGEYYWKIYFQDVEGSAWVGLTNENRCKKGYGTKGLFYGGNGGNLSDGGGLLVQHFGPCVKGNDVVGMIVSMIDSKLRLYFDHNGIQLGLAFEVDASILPDAWPLVRFSSKGSARIEKQARIPRTRFAVIRKFTEVEGPWQVVPQTIKLNGNILEETEDMNFVTMKITSIENPDGQESNLYEIHLRVRNHISFTVEKQPHGWKGCQDGPVKSTKMGASSKTLELERGITQICQIPDSVTFNNINQITITKGDSTVSFKRYDDSARPVLKNPFN